MRITPTRGGGPGSRPCGGAGLRPEEAADQRSGSDVPVPDLLEVVLRVQQAPPRRRDQLSVDRLGRRHPAVEQPDRLLRGQRRTHDQRAAPGGAGRDPPLPVGPRRRRARLQHPRASTRTSSSRARSWPTSSSARSRNGTIRPSRLEPRSESSRHRHRRRPPLRRLRHDLYLGGLPLQDLPRLEEEGRHRDVGQLARGHRRQGERRRGRPGQADARLDRLRRADLCHPEQDQLRLGPEHGRRVRPGDARVGDRGRGRRGRRMPPDFRVSITNAPGTARTRSRPSRGCCSTRARRKKTGQDHGGLLNWALTDGQKFAPELGYAPLPKEVVALETAALKKIKL